MTPAHERARRALRCVGLDPDVPLEIADSHANEAWLGPGYALRVNFRGDVGRLAREASLAERLPPEARYPGVLEAGNDGSIEWILTRRVPGIPLAHAWPTLDVVERERATRQLVLALSALHAVDPTGLPGDADLSPPHVLPLDRLLSLHARVADDLGDLADPVAAFLTDHWAAFDEAGRGVVHGDPHLENVLWHEGELTALLDLEWSRPSWLEVDLETLLSVCDHPAEFVAEAHEERVHAAMFRGVPAWLRAEAPHWFAHPRLHERLAVLHVARMLTLPVRGPRRRRIEALLDGHGFLSRWA